MAKKEPKTTKEAVNMAEGLSNANTATASPKERAKVRTIYIVTTLPANRQKLSPQLRALVASIDECQVQNAEGKSIVYRDEIFASWSKAIGSESGDKVFASYMHQLLSFAFLERIEGEHKPRKIVSPEERKSKMKEMLSKLSEADRKEILASLGL